MEGLVVSVAAAAGTPAPALAPVPTSASRFIVAVVFAVLFVHQGECAG